MKKLGIILSIVSLAGLVAFSIPAQKTVESPVIEETDLMAIENFQPVNDGVFDFDSEAE